MQKPTLCLGSDHAGYLLKQAVINRLKEEGYPIKDFGTYGTDSCDYPDFAHPVAEQVASDPEQQGILICGSANGVAITANKHRGVRAAIAWLPELAKLARLHNHANILCLPARYLTEEMALECIHSFLTTSFEGERHQKRIDKIEIQQP